MYADVVFPLKLSPLTYKVPEDAPHDLKGRIVKTPLMGRSHYGLVVSVANESEIRDKKNIKEIQSIHQHFASDSNISFLKWLAEYYLTPMGIALKSSFFEEAVVTLSDEGSRGQADKGSSNLNPRTLESSNPDVSLIHNSIKSRNYKSFFLHAPSISHEYSLLDEILNKANSDINGAIILVPEISQIEGLASMLRNIFGERLCILHGRLTKKKRTEAITQIITGKSDVVLGTRSAILAPLRNVSFIAVLNEHSPSYKGEEGLRYNARDVAVMRGFMEKSCVLLSSVCPSVESIHNTTIGKYTMLTQIAHPSNDVIARSKATRQPHYLEIASPSARNDTQSPAKRPRIRVIDMRKYKRKTLAISGDVLKEAKVTTSKNGRFLFLVNRKGYSLIRCEDCGHIIQCRKCSIPLVLYKSKNMVKCHYCGHEETVHENCEECKGFNMRPFGTGTERIKEELTEILKTEVLLIEKTKSASKTLSEISPDFTPFVVGTGYAARKLRDEKLDAVALFNIDGLLAQPDFRTYERAFQEVAQISQMVKSDGTIFLQSWNPRNKILRFIRNYDFHGFYEHELSQRKMLDYPPFSRMILFNVFMKKDVEQFSYDIQKIIGDTNTNGLELLGPIEIPSSLKSYRHCIQILLKSKDRKVLHSAAEKLLSKFEKLKGAKINVDVDPLKI
ncbi:MAG: primosomal protein N' [Nitrospiraceae bacterium]|nr:primosomal protein N' [Nitrospirota bacterium]MDA8337990.1 primosomal protein N' [Nitrospiraceae bacterium]